MHEILNQEGKLTAPVRNAGDLYRQHPWVRELISEGKRPEKWKQADTLPVSVCGPLKRMDDSGSEGYQVANQKVYVEEAVRQKSGCTFTSEEKVWVIGRKEADGIKASLVLPEWVHSMISRFSLTYLDNLWLAAAYMSPSHREGRPLLKQMYHDSDFCRGMIRILAEAALAGHKNRSDFRFEELERKYGVEAVKQAEILAGMLGFCREGLPGRNETFWKLLRLYGSFRKPEEISLADAAFAGERWLDLCPGDEAVVLMEEMLTSDSCAAREMLLGALCRFPFADEYDALCREICAKVFRDPNAGSGMEKKLARGVNGPKLVCQLRMLAWEMPEIGYAKAAGNLMIERIRDLGQDPWEEAGRLYENEGERWIGVAMFAGLMSASTSPEHNTLLEENGIKAFILEFLTNHPESKWYELGAFMALELILTGKMASDEVPAAFADCAVERMKRGLSCIYTEQLLAMMPLEIQCQEIPVKPLHFKKALTGRICDKPEVIWSLLARKGVWSRYEIWQHFEEVCHFYNAKRNRLDENSVSARYLDILLDHLRNADLFFPELYSSFDHRLLAQPLTPSEIGRVEVFLDKDGPLVIGNCMNAWVLLRYLETADQDKKKSLLKKTVFRPLAAGSGLVVTWYHHLCRAGLGEEAVAFYRQYKLYLDRPASYNYKKLGKYLTHEEVLDFLMQMNRAQAGILAALKEGDTDVLRCFMSNPHTRGLVHNAGFVVEAARLADLDPALTIRLGEIYGGAFGTGRLGTIQGKSNVEILREACMEMAVETGEEAAWDNLYAFMAYERLISRETEVFPFSDFYDDRTWLMHILETDKHSHRGILYKYGNDARMGMTAVKVCGSSIRFLSEKLRKDEAICAAAIASDSDAIHWVLNERLLRESREAGDRLMQALEEI